MSIETALAVLGVVAITIAAIWVIADELVNDITDSTALAMQLDFTDADADLLASLIDLPDPFAQTRLEIAALETTEERK